MDSPHFGSSLPDSVRLRGNFPSAEELAEKVIPRAEMDLSG
jgi:hypothetical protein